MMSKRMFVISLIVVGLLINGFNFAVRADSGNGIFLIRNSDDWNKAGFDDLGIYYNKLSLTEFYMPIALSKDDVHNLQNKDVNHTIYNRNQNFTDRLRSISFEILESDIYYVVIYHMLVYASDKSFHIDFVPKIKGEELYPFAWWDSDWSYYKQLSITNPINNYQMFINVTKISGGDVNCSGHCENDFADIRFIDIDNTTEIGYWKEKYVSDEYIWYWINLSSDVETDNAILIYYGSSTAVYIGNGSNVFLYFENWTTDNTGDWWSFRETEAGGDDTASNVLNITGGVGYNKRLRYRHTMEYWYTVGTGCSLRISYCSDEWDGTYQYPDDWIGTLTTASSGDGSSATAQAWVVYDSIGGSSGLSYEITDPFDQNSYYVRDFTILSNNATSKQYDDSGSLLGIVSQTDDARIPSASDLDDIVIFSYVDTGDAYFEHDAVNGEIIVGGNRTTTAIVFSIDWMFMSKYIVPEPSILSVSEEMLPLFIMNPYPIDNSIDICPCIDYMSIDIDYINNMNLSFYHSIGDTSNFHIMEKYYNLTSGTYSFCMCGHSFVPAYIYQHTNDSTNVALPGLWRNINFVDKSDTIKNINHTFDDLFTILYDGIYRIAYRLSFEDTAVAPTSESYGRVIVNGIEVAGTLQMKGMFNKNEISSVSAHVITQLYSGDTVQLSFTGDSTTIKLASHTLYGDIPTSAILTINRIDDADLHPMHYNETYYWYVNLSEYGNPSNYNVSSIYKFTTMEKASDCEILSESKADELFLSSAFSLTEPSMLFILWLFLIVLGEWKRDMLYKTLQIPLGVFYGITLLESEMWLGLIMICVSIYIGAMSIWQYRKE